MQKIVLWVGECFGVTASRTIDSSCYKLVIAEGISPGMGVKIISGIIKQDAKNE